MYYNYTSNLSTLRKCHNWFPVDSRAVSEGNGGSDVSSDSPSAGVIAGVVVAVTVVCAALAVLVVIGYLVIAVVYLAKTKRPQIVNR